MGLLNKLKTVATDAKLNLQQPSGNAQPSPASSLAASPFVVAQHGQLFCQGRPYRFVGLNAPELLDGDVNGPFEYWHTFATLAADRAFGRAVTRTYTLRVGFDLRDLKESYLRWRFTSQLDRPPHWLTFGFARFALRSSPRISEEGTSMGGTLVGEIGNGTRSDSK